MWIATAIYCALYLLEDGILYAIFDQPIYLKLDLIGKVDYSKRILQDTIRSTLTLYNHKSEFYVLETIRYDVCSILFQKSPVCIYSVFEVMVY